MFLDTDHDDGIAPGRDWQHELFRELRLCQAVVFLNSAASQRSMWCHTEIALALERAKPVYPLDLESPLSPHPILTQVQGIRLERDLESSARELVERLTTDIGSVPRGRWDRRRSPYPGLRSFDESDAAVFFGRDLDVRRVLDRIDPSIPEPDGQLFAIIGASGAGKSSLVRAGVVPRLLDQKGWVVAPPFEPGTFPLDRLAASLTAAGGHPVDASTLRSEGLARVASRLLDARPGSRRLLIVIDQAEQLTTLLPADRDPFLQVMATGLVAHSPVTLVITLRQDRLNEMQPLAPIGPMIREPFVVAPLDRSALALVIEGPASKADLSIEPGLTQLIIDDAMRGAEDDPGRSLPLIAFTLQQMYDCVTAAHDDTMGIHHYEEVGRIEGAIGRRTSQAEARLAGDQSDALNQLLMRFVQIPDNRVAGSKPVALDSLSASEAVLVDRLADERLIVADAGTARLVHDRLIESWPRLAEAVRVGRDDLVRRTRLEQRAAAWSGGDDFLLGPDAAKEARTWLETQPDHTGVPPTVIRYVEASEKGIRRRRRQILAVASAIISLALVAGTLAVASSRQSGRRRTERDMAFAVSLAETARASVNDQLVRSLLLAVDASSVMERVDPDRSGAAARRVWGTLLDIVHVADGTDRTLHLPEDPNAPGLLSKPSITADGRRVAAGAWLTTTIGHEPAGDPQFYVWDVGPNTTTLRGIGKWEGRVVSIQFGASNRYVAVTSADDAKATNALEIWDLEPGHERRVHREVSPTVTGTGTSGRTLAPSIQISPDGRTFVVQRFKPAEYTVIDATTTKLLTRGKGVTGSYLDGDAFSPDGRYLVAVDLAAGSASRPVMLDLWRSAARSPVPGGEIGAIPMPRFALKAPVMLAADPKGRVLVGTPGSAKISHRLGEVASGAFALSPDGSSAVVVFSPADPADPADKLPIAAFDLRLARPDPVVVVRGFTSFTDVAFSPHGNYLSVHLSASQAGATFSSLIVDNPLQKLRHTFQVIHGWPILYAGERDQRAVVVTPDPSRTTVGTEGRQSDQPSYFPVGRPCESAVALQFWDLVASRQISTSDDLACTTSMDHRFLVFAQSKGGGRLVDLGDGSERQLPGGSLPWSPAFGLPTRGQETRLAVSTLAGSVLSIRSGLTPAGATLDSALETTSDANPDGSLRAVVHGNTVNIRDLKRHRDHAVALPDVAPDATPSFGWVAVDRLQIGYQGTDGRDRTIVVSSAGKPLWDPMFAIPLASMPTGTAVMVARTTPTRTIELWDVPKGTPPRSPVIHSIPLGRLVERAELFGLGWDLSLDGSLLAISTQDGRTEIRQVSDGTRLRILPPPNRSVTDGQIVPQFSPDGRRLAVGFGNQWLAIYDVGTGTVERFRRFPLQRSVTPRAFTADGSLLVTGDGSFLDSDSLEPVAGPFDADSQRPKLTVKGDGLLVGGLVGPLVRLDLESDVLRRSACQLAGRNLTRAEWRLSHGAASYRRTCPQWPVL